MDALYTINLPLPEYVGMVEDACRLIIIQATIQFLYYINNNVDAFFTADFCLLTIYIVLGVCVYWLVFKKLIIFK